MGALIDLIGYRKFKGCPLRVVGPNRLKCGQWESTLTEDAIDDLFIALKCVASGLPLRERTLRSGLCVEADGEGCTISGWDLDPVKMSRDDVFSLLEELEKTG